MKHDSNGTNGWRFASPISHRVKFDPQAPPFSLEVANKDHYSNCNKHDIPTQIGNFPWRP